MAKKDTKNKAIFACQILMVLTFYLTIYTLCIGKKVAFYNGQEISTYEVTLLALKH